MNVLYFGFLIIEGLGKLLILNFNFISFVVFYFFCFFVGFNCIIFKCLFVY